MAINKRKLLKNTTLSLIYLTCITHAYSMNPNVENINNIINNSNNNVNSQLLQNISSNNNINRRNRPIFVCNKINDNSNKNTLLCKKTQRSNEVKTNKKTRESKNNVTFRYDNFIRANKTLKTLIEKEKNELQTHYNNCNDNEKLSPQAKRCFNKIKDLTELGNKNFPILNLRYRYTNMDNYFNLNNILKQISLLRRKIKNKMTGENYNKFKNILYQIDHNQQMDKKLYNKLVNIGLIKRNKCYVKFYESAEQLETVKKQQEMSETFLKIHNEINDTNNINKIRNNFERFYKIIIDLNNIETIFTHHSSVAEIVQKKLVSSINNIINNNIKNDIMPFGIEKTIFTFNNMKERFIDGYEVQMDFVKSYIYNRKMFLRYYKNMFSKSDVFTTSVIKELYNIQKASINLAKYYNDTTSVNIGLFLADNEKSVKDTIIKMRGEWDKIFCEAYTTQLKHIDNFRELLKELSDKINNGNEFEKEEGSFAFLTQITCNVDTIRNCMNDYKILTDIFSNKYFNKIVTKKIIENMFRNRYKHIRKLIQNGEIQGNNIQDEYTKNVCEYAIYSIRNNIERFKNIKNTVDIKLPEGLNEILSDYISEMQKSLDIECKKYIYASKFIIDIDKAIVPAGFWDNKLIK